MVADTWTHGGANDQGHVPSLPPMHDAASLLIATNRYFLDDESLVSELRGCLCGVNFGVVDGAASNVVVNAITRQLLCRMEQRVAVLPIHVRNNFVWAACRENAHSVV